MCLPPKCFPALLPMSGLYLTTSMPCSLVHPICISSPSPSSSPSLPLPLLLPLPPPTVPYLVGCGSEGQCPGEEGCVVSCGQGRGEGDHPCRHRRCPGDQRVGDVCGEHQSIHTLNGECVGAWLCDNEVPARK